MNTVPQAIGRDGRFDLPLAAGCIIAGLTVSVTPALADEKVAAAVLETCFSSAHDLAKIAALAEKSDWAAEDAGILTFPLSKRGDVLQRKSA